MLKQQPIVYQLQFAQLSKYNADGLLVHLPEYVYALHLLSNADVDDSQRVSAM